MATLGNRVRRRLRLAQRYLRLFTSWRDRWTYYRCRHAPRAAQPMSLRVRDVPVPLWCRPRTSDASALWSAYGEDYHLPDFELPAQAVILDLGANVGYTVVDFARRYPTARVIGVEMDRANAELATRNIEPLKDRCTIVHAAVWIEEGWISYDGPREVGYRVSKRDGARRTPHEPGSGMVAPCVTISSVLQSQHIERVDFMKMDIEGAETEVLAAGGEWLSRVAAMTLELHAFAAVPRCRDLLERAGFTARAHPRHPRGLLARRLSGGPRVP